MAGAPEATATTLRIPPRVLLIGMTYKDSAAQVELLISAPYLVASELDLDRALSKLRSAKFEFVMIYIDVT